MKKLLSVLILLFFCLTLFSNVIADDDEKIKKHPGYVDFDKIEIPKDAEESVEVYVRGPLLKLVAAVTEKEDPALAKMLEKMLLIRVNTFSIDDKISKDLKSKVEDINKQLEKQKWEKIVKVKDKGERVNVYMKFDKNDQMAGLVVMAIEDNDEAVFVNIVGELDWSQISKLGHKFDIDELDGFSDEKKPR
jgi:hypothetical protein